MNLRHHASIVIGTLIVVTLALETWFSYFGHSLQTNNTDLTAFRALYPDAAPDILALKPYNKGLWSAPEFSVAVDTDFRGFRCPSDIEAEDAELIVMGDSFTFGHGVEGSERYGEILSKLSHKKTLVTSYNNGWASPHYLKYFELNPRLRPKYIVVGLYLGNDFYSDIQETVILRAAPFDLRLPLRAVDPDGRLVNRVRLSNRWLELIRSQSAFGRWVLNSLVRGGLIAPPAFLLDHGAEVATPNSRNPEALDRGESSPEFELSFSFVKQLEAACIRRNPTAGYRSCLSHRTFSYITHLFRTPNCHLLIKRQYGKARGH